MDSEWRLLSLEYSSTDIPPLLVKYKFENSSYTVYLSDMTECWIETLDRKQIIKRALEIDTSIDPSEGVDQFRSLLRCLRDALAESTDARLTVQRWSREEMVIAVESPLPRPLDPLKWVFYFKRGESCAFTDQLLMPLLDQKLADASATSLLLTEIREKDSLISKLLDAIQADGVSMSRIFPSLQPAKTRVRSYSRQILGKSIKGMSEFDEGKWRTEMRHVDYSSLSPPALISKAFSNQTDDFGRNIKFGDLVSWRNFVRGSAIQSEGQSATETRHPESEGKVGNGQDAGQTSQRKQIFPEQENPTLGTNHELHSPRNELGSPFAVSNKNVDSGDSTTDSDSDHDGSASPPKPEQNEHDNKVSSQLSQKTSSIPIRQSRSLSPDDGFALKQDENHSPGIRPLQPKSGSDDLSTPKKGKIGRIGGKRQTQAKDPPDSPEAKTSPEQNKPNTAKAISHKDTDTRMHSTSRSNVNENLGMDPAQQPRETSRERVSKKREALKRELEAKSQAAGKKKRRF